MEIDHRSHGGRVAEFARLAGLPEAELLDYSANLNPWGPPSWLPEAIDEGLDRVSAYPDPEAEGARRAASLRFGVPPERFLFADGADSLIFALPRALKVRSLLCPSPGYSGYLRAGLHAGLEPGKGLSRLSLDPEEGFSQASEGFWASLHRGLAGAEKPALVFLGSPNNPAGGSPPLEAVLEALRRHPGVHIALDESFIELAGGGDESLSAASRPGGEGLIVLRSLTKTWAVPGLRAGFASASPGVLAALRAELPAWPLSSFAEAFSVRAMADRLFPEESAGRVRKESARFSARLGGLPGLKVFSSGANFLLLEFGPQLASVREIAGQLLRRGIATRLFSPEEGLDGRYMRIAVRLPGENDRFLAALEEVLLKEPGREAGSCGA